MVHCWPRSKYHDHICYYIYTARVIAILFDMKVAHAIICFPFIEMSRSNCTKQATLKDTSALVGLISRHESSCAKLGTCRSLSCIFGVSLSKNAFYFFCNIIMTKLPQFSLSWSLLYAQFSKKKNHVASLVIRSWSRALGVCIETRQPAHAKQNCSYFDILSAITIRQGSKIMWDSNLKWGVSVTCLV